MSPLVERAHQTLLIGAAPPPRPPRDLLHLGAAQSPVSVQSATVLFHFREDDPPHAEVETHPHRVRRYKDLVLAGRVIEELGLLPPSLRRQVPVDDGTLVV